MAISQGKSKIMVMISHIPPNLEVNFNGNRILPTKSERYLGLFLSSNLTWQDYIYGETWQQKENFPGI